MRDKHINEKVSLSQLVNSEEWESEQVCSSHLPWSNLLFGGVWRGVGGTERERGEREMTSHTNIAKSILDQKSDQTP